MFRTGRAQLEYVGCTGCDDLYFGTEFDWEECLQGGVKVVESETLMRYENF